MNTLKQLLETAYKTIETEDGTVADLGIVPTGHTNKDVKELEKEEKDSIIDD